MVLQFINGQTSIKHFRSECSEEELSNRCSTNMVLIMRRGNTMDSHRLIYFARQHGLDKQHDLVEELNIGYFTQGKYIGDQ